MNYIRELNAFMDWLETNPLEATTQALWLHIMAVANKSGWPEWFTIANRTLEARVGVSENTLNKHRNRLIDLKRIEYESQGKQRAGKYRILSLAEQYTSNYEVKDEVKHEANCEVKGAALFKLKETKQDVVKYAQAPPESATSENEGIPSPRQGAVPAVSELDADSNRTKISNSEYRQRVSDKYIQRRAKGFDLSIPDLKALDEIVSEDVPLQIALDGIDKAFNEFVPEHSRDKINALSYCVPIILSLLVKHKKAENSAAIPESFREGDKHPAAAEEPAVTVEDAEIEELLSQMVTTKGDGP